MVEWHLFEGDAIERLKEKLDTGYTAITLAQMNAQRWNISWIIFWKHRRANDVMRNCSISEESNKSIVNQRLPDLFELESKVEEKLDGHFDDLMSRMDEQTAILTRIQTEVGNVISAV